jgi:putative membrane protein insertion efficiency factor
MGYPQRKLFEKVRRNDLTTRSHARSNTALFRIGRWLPSAPINPPRHGVPGATDSWCAAALPADARYCATGAPAGVAGSRYSRCDAREALRARRGAPAAAQGGFRAAAATGKAPARRRLHLLHRATRSRATATGYSRIAQAQRGGRGAQLPQALHPRGLSPGTGEARPGRSAGAAARAHRGLGGHDQAVAKASGRNRQMIASVLRFGVRAYQVAVSPLLPRACRFHPSCSEYASEALARHGACRGCWLAARRLVRCGPWHPGGYDPVP